jgi:hypothetical protein
MGFILKNTSGLISSKITDTGRKKMSEGKFNISYFQVGDSEISYNSLPSSYNQFTTMILEPGFNSQNSSGFPQLNKQYLKYPTFAENTGTNTYGVPYMDSNVFPVFNQAAMRGFFTGNTQDETINWSAQTTNQYVLNSNYVINMSTLSGGTTIQLIYSGCNSDIVRLPMIGDLITIYYDGKGQFNCVCETEPPTPEPTTTTTTSTTIDPCAVPEPTTTTTSTTTTTTLPPPTPQLDCYISIDSCYPVMTYKIVDICLNQVTLDRPTPDYSGLNDMCYARVLIYPPKMTDLYDSITPQQHWSDDVINYESICETDQFDVKIWNMNIPWSENPAGLQTSTTQDYSTFGSITYLGTKEYLGYTTNDGQTDTSESYFNNSFGEKVVVEPNDQKVIAIVHYTNQTIDFFYGEKFAMEEFNTENPEDTTGQGRNFKVHIPWLMWHKNENCCNGVTFWVDPPLDEDLGLFEPHYIKSNLNSDMNNPGIRYYHLWDTNIGPSGLPNRVGKVFPDSHLIIFDDEEIVAAMSYKSNRSWTLPAPKVSLITPNILTTNTSGDGVLTGKTETMYVTYRLSNDDVFTNSLHCNYYLKISGPDVNCFPTAVPQDVAVRFGSEFNCMVQPNQDNNLTTTTTTACPNNCNAYGGFIANKFEIICQKVIGDEKPDSSEWRIIDYTEQLTDSMINGFITQEGLTGTTFVITKDLYDNADFYDLTDYIELPSIGQTGKLNFGDEYYFYGNIETDIQATIYEMRYKINLTEGQFQRTSNPTWVAPTIGQQTPPTYITEIGLYDDKKDLMIISKLQSPVLRQGVQQFLIKFDF